MADDELVADLQASRRRFLALVADLRPELHRYCARMTGSVSDGEDIVQETLARAYYEISEIETMPPLRYWLFRIAHRRALDFLRRYDRRMGQPLDIIENAAIDDASGAAQDPEEALAREEATRAALSHFVELAPLQRSSVILKDVLGLTLEEIAELLDLGVPSIKAALHRGRVKLRELAERTREPAPVRPVSADLARYAALFNARDWDAVRALLVEDVKLDLVSRARRAGRAVGDYFTNYDSVSDWRLVPAWLDGREVLAVFRDAKDARPGYFVELTFERGGVALIRDYRYVPYIALEADLRLAPRA